MKKNTYTCNMRGVKNEADIIYRIRKALDLFPDRTESEELLRIESNYIGGYLALADDMSRLPVYAKDPEIKDIELIITNYLDIKNNISEKAEYDLLSLLAWQTDPSQRLDNLLFSFSVRLN